MDRLIRHLVPAGLLAALAVIVIATGRELPSDELRSAHGALWDNDRSILRCGQRQSSAAMKMAIITNASPTLTTVPMRNPIHAAIPTPAARPHCR